MLDPDFVVADVGSGTGKSSILMLPHVKKTVGVEPNDAMRAEAERLLSGQSKFESQTGTANETGLQSQSFDMVVVGHAFHWFDPEKTKAEFSRILRPNRPVVLLWNKRHHEASNFMRAFRDFIKEFSHKDWPEDYVSDERVFDRFYDGSWDKAIFKNEQTFDFEGLKGFYLSTSYSFAEGHPRHAEALEALENLYRRFEYDGQVVMSYKTVMYYGLFNTRPVAIWKKTVFHLLRIPAFFMYQFLQTAMFFKMALRKLKRKLKGEKGPDPNGSIPF